MHSSNLISAGKYLAGGVLLLTLLFGCQPAPNGEIDEANGLVLSQDNTLESQFLNPPSSVKPQTWFHAMSGNMSKLGITKDLESMAEVGIGGFVHFNVTQGIPLGDIKFNSDAHIELITHMAAEAERLGLSFGLHNSDGWTSSGGPWVTPQQSMKKVVWSEHYSSGGQLDITLAEPVSLHNFYKDIAVLAYPSLASEIMTNESTPTLSASNNDFSSALVTNKRSDEHTPVTLNPQNPANNITLVSNSKPTDFEVSEKPWIQFSYDEALTIQSIEARFYEGRGLQLYLYVSDDGNSFTFHQKLPLRRPGKRIWGTDAVIDPVSAKHFRVYGSLDFKVLEMSMSGNTLMHNYLGRTSAARTDYNRLVPIGQPKNDEIIQSSSIINISDKMDDNGNLSVRLPEGQWTILRFGYTTTGAVNIPASKEGTGLEVDKFSREAFLHHYNSFVKRVLDKAKIVAPNAVRFLEIDSYEVGGQNWTTGYEDLFAQRFNYDLVTFLPLFTGRFVDSPKHSEGILWDTRTLNGELITNNYYGYFTELANQDGLQTYIEPYGFGPFNDIDAGGKADIPMGEFWLNQDKLKIAAATSATRIYGKKITSAEAFTGWPDINWRFHPAMAKLDGDRSWALGINELMFHRFAHQANTHVMPGMTMNRWGAHFDRTQTWWYSAGKEWFRYMARGQLLLQKGVAVSDVLWYLGDAAPTACPEKLQMNGILPNAINYDCLNSDVLNNRLQSDDLGIFMPNGARYKWLYLNNIDSISMQSLKSLYRLSQNGVVMVGKAPTQLADWRASEQDNATFKTLVDFIWSQKTTYTSLDWELMYQNHGFVLDMDAKGLRDILYTHRKDADKDIYFLYNPDSKKQLFDVTFNVANKIPELFDPLTGKTSKLAVFKNNTNNTTRTQFILEQNASIFVVFREDSDDVANVEPSKMIASALQNGLTLSLNKQNEIEAESSLNQAYTIDNGQLIFDKVPAREVFSKPWELTFNPFYGLDKSYSLNTLIDWVQHPDSQVQDYSGTAVYKTTFTLNEQTLANSNRVWLNLGEVHISAGVSINQQDIGTSWLAPHKLDITDMVTTGENTLEVEVANLWINRLIADESLADTSGFEVAKRSNNPVTPMVQWYKDNQPPPPTQRVTFTTQAFFKATDEKVESGLIGPVTLSFSQTKLID